MINCFLFYTYIFNREMSDVISAALRRLRLFIYSPPEEAPTSLMMREHGDANALGTQWST